MWGPRARPPRWRSFTTEYRTSESVNVIDGDLVERFLVLPPSAMEAVLRGDHGGQLLDNVSIDSLTKTIEELARLH